MKYNTFLRLDCDFVMLCLLVAELGDFQPEEHTHGYLSELRFIMSQTEGFEKEVEQVHKQLRWMSPQSDLNQRTQAMYI